MHRFMMAAAIALLPVLGHGAPPAPARDDGFYTSLTFENDTFADTDRGYTNGVYASFLWPEGVMPQLARQAGETLPLFDENGVKRFSFAIGQSMFTPDDIKLRNPPQGQRPYAGWLYGTFGISSNTANTLDQYQLTLGIVGPSSLAEQTQKIVHKAIDVQEPLGWDTQLKDEPGVVLAWQRKWRPDGLAFELGPVGVDFSPYTGVALGNVFTNASIGGIWRLGVFLPNDYGPPRIGPSLSGADFFVPSRKVGGYLFVGAEGRAVGRNIFLDGNTFRDSRSVDKRYFVGDLLAGFAATLGDWRLAYSQVWRSPEHEGQQGFSEYGGLTLTRRF